MALADTTKYVCAYYTTLPSANLLIDTVQYSRSTVSFFDRSLREDDIPYDVAIPSAHQNHDENGSNKYTMNHHDACQVDVDDEGIENIDMHPCVLTLL